MSRTFSSGEFATDFSKAMSGYDFERQFFKVSSRGVSTFALCDYIPARAHAIKRHRRRGWDSKKPRTEIAKKLFENVQIYLGEALSDRLELYCSIGTALDQHHGIDGFFTIGTHDITFDLSTHLKKDYKAKFLITPGDLEDGVRWKLGREIAYIFKEHEQDRLAAEKIVV
jgi:hypothetical protein